jgi:hypothetical protein
MFADAILMQEILGLLEDMLNDASIKSNTYSDLKTIKHLLNELLHFKSSQNLMTSSNMTLQIKNGSGLLKKTNKLCSFDKSGDFDEVETTPFFEKHETVSILNRSYIVLYNS